MCIRDRPIAKEIGAEYEVEPKRMASILDIFTSVTQGIIPYGAQLLTAAGLAAISPMELIPNLYYPILMGVSAVVFICFVPVSYTHLDVYKRQV